MCGLAILIGVFGGSGFEQKSSGPGGKKIADYPARGQGIVPSPNDGQPLVITMASPEMGMNGNLAMNPHPP